MFDYLNMDTVQCSYIMISSNVILSTSIYSTRINRTTDDQEKIKAFLEDKLKGEFCYVQTGNGKIVSIHYSPTKDEEAINVKRGITGAFQANFDNQKEVEESDPGSSHVSHYRYV